MCTSLTVATWQSCSVVLLRRGGGGGGGNSLTFMTGRNAHAKPLSQTLNQSDEISQRPQTAILPNTLSALPGVPKKTLNVWFDVRWKRLYLHNLFLYFLNRHTPTSKNFSIKQSKICWKFAEQWLPKVKISEPVDGRRPDFFEKSTNLRQPYCFNNVHWSVTIS